MAAKVEVKTPSSGRGQESEDMDFDSLNPILMKTEVPELRQEGNSDTVVWPGSNVSWMEFVKMFSEEPQKYVVKGEFGQILNMESNVGEYVASFKVPAEIYPVTVERRIDGLPPVPAPPKGKGKRGRPRLTSAVRTARVRRGRKKSGQQQGEPILPPQINGVQDKSLNLNGATKMTEIENQATTAVCKRKRRVSSMMSEPESVSSTTNRKSDSISNDLGVTTDPLNIKPKILNFLEKKVKNRDLLRIREELMKLKDDEDYFKFTALTPLAAGLLDQMLCRSLPVPSKPSAS